MYQYYKNIVKQYNKLTITCHLKNKLNSQIQVLTASRVDEQGRLTTMFKQPDPSS